MGDGRLELSVIVPAYDEARRIGATLHEIARFLAEHSPSSELIVVDDGSRDTTVDVIRELAPRLPISLLLLHYEPNRGKGHALKVGFAASRGERILFSDADLSTPVEDAPRLLAALGNAELAIGSRKVAGAQISLHQPRVRQWLGQGFTLLVRLLLADVSDATCGFKAFRGDVGRELFSRMRIEGWSFDAELLYLARRRRYRIAEVPVHWRHDDRSKVDLRRDVGTTLMGLGRILWNAARGVYAEVDPIRVEVERWQKSEEAVVPEVSEAGRSA